MKKFASILLSAFAMASIGAVAIGATKYNYVVPAAPYISPSLKPCIAKYRAGNYTGAMLDLKEVVKNEKNNLYAKYYLALSYTQLGYSEEAKALYSQIIEAKEKHSDTLEYYARKGIVCIDDPTSQACTGAASVNAKNNQVSEGESEEGEAKGEASDDITQFIESGAKIHPAAMDTIINKRMERRLEQYEYDRNKQRENTDSISYLPPTNEEIASALNTLSKIGINPFEQNYVLSERTNGYINPYNNSFLPVNYKDTSSDIGQLLLYSQLNQQKNNFINYGI